MRQPNQPASSLAVSGGGEPMECGRGHPVSRWQRRPPHVPTGSCLRLAPQYAAANSSSSRAPSRRQQYRPLQRVSEKGWHRLCHTRAVRTNVHHHRYRVKYICPAMRPTMCCVLRVRRFLGFFFFLALRVELAIVLAV